MSSARDQQPTMLETLKKADIVAGRVHTQIGEMLTWEANSTQYTEPRRDFETAIRKDLIGLVHQIHLATGSKP